MKLANFIVGQNRIITSICVREGKRRNIFIYEGSKKNGTKDAIMALRRRAYIYFKCHRQAYLIHHSDSTFPTTPRKELVEVM